MSGGGEIEDDGAVFAAAFGVVHGLVGAVQEGLGVVVGRGEGYADAGLDGDIDVAAAQRLAQLLADTFGDAQRFRQAE